MRDNRSNFVPLIIVVLAAPAAALLFVAALVVWLAEMMGSILYPCLIVGVFLAILALLLYKASLRDAMREIHDRFGAIYELTKIVREGVDWVARFLFPILNKRG